MVSPLRIDFDTCSIPQNPKDCKSALRQKKCRVYGGSCKSRLKFIENYVILNIRFDGILTVLTENRLRIQRFILRRYYDIYRIIHHAFGNRDRSYRLLSV